VEEKNVEESEILPWSAIQKPQRIEDSECEWGLIRDGEGELESTNT